MFSFFQLRFHVRAKNFFLLFLLIAAFVFYPWHSFASTHALLVKNAYIFTMAAQQHAPFNGYLLIDGTGTIVQIGKGKPPADLHADKIVNAHGDWMIPGFVSAHSHLWQAAYRGLAADKTLMKWIDDLYTQKATQAKPEDFYWYCLLGAYDHLEHGITTVYNFNYNTIFVEPKINAYDELQFRAEEKSGIRFVHGYQIDMISPSTTYQTARTRLSAFLNWAHTQPPSATFLAVMLNGMTAFNNTYQQAVTETALMKEFQLGNQSHYLEPPDTQQDERAKFKWFSDSGMLSKQLIFGHFVHVDANILSRSAQAGVAMSWNPLSNGRLASGTPDIPVYLQHGMRVGMGVDGEASADLADPFENMRTGLYAIRAKYENATIMSPYQMLWLQTMGSADVLGVKNKVGSLEPGKFADFILLNPARLGVVLEDPYANLVLAASASDIEQVYVGGKLVIKNQRLLHAHLNQVQKEVNLRVLRTAKI